MLPDPTSQFRDYVIWQQQRLRGSFLTSEVTWWTEYLKDLTPLDFPTDRQRLSTQSGRGASYRLQLSAQLTDELKSFSQRQGLTLFMSLLGTFNVLLYRYTGQRDFAIGLPMAGRNRLSDESVIGFFCQYDGR